MITKRLHGDYVLLRTGDLRLLVSQTDLIDIIHLQDKSSVTGHNITDPKLLNRFLVEGSSGTSNEQHFVALSSNLTLLSHIPPSSFVMTTHPQTADCQWCWDEVLLINDFSGITSPLPAIICNRNTPVEAIVTLPSGNQALVSHFDKLLHYVIEH